MKTEEHIVTELSNRVIEALDGLRLDEVGIKKGTDFLPKSIYSNAVLYLNNSLEYDFSIYPEYRQRTFRSLIIELSAIESPSAQPRLKETVAAFEKLVDLASVRFDFAQEPKQQQVPHEQEKELEAVRDARDLLRTILLSDCLKSSTVPEFQEFRQETSDARK